MSLSGYTPSLSGGLTSFGPITQLGFVPQHVDDALHFWTTVMGVGPFFHQADLALSAVYRDRPVELQFSQWIAYYGQLQIELVKPSGGQGILFNEHEQGNGVHHACIEIEDMSIVRPALQAVGSTFVLESEFANGMGQVAYVEIPSAPLLMEFIQLPASAKALFCRMQKASRDWNGSDPVRLFSDAG